MIFSKPIAHTSCRKRIIHCTKSKQHLKIGCHGSVRIPMVPFDRGRHWTPVKLCPYGEGHARFGRVTIVVTMTRCGHKLSLQRSLVRVRKVELLRGILWPYEPTFNGQVSTFFRKKKPLIAEFIICVGASKNHRAVYKCLQLYFTLTKLSLIKPCTLHI